MLLLVDTETSGLYRDDLPVTAPEQPHMVQLGAQLFDSQFRRRANMTVLIKPEGWSIEPQAEAVHGISAHMCHRAGISLAEALIPLRGLVNAASRVAGHHVQFDRKVIAASCHRAGGEGLWWSRINHKFLCTMETATEVCALPSEFGLKFPSLEEAVAILCPGADLPVRHDAESDIAATLAVYRALLDRGIIEEADPFARAGESNA